MEAFFIFQIYIYIYGHYIRYMETIFYLFIIFKIKDNWGFRGQKSEILIPGQIIKFVIYEKSGLSLVFVIVVYYFPYIDLYIFGQVKIC